MNVLLTGASGVVGRPLAVRCEAAGLTTLRVGRQARGAGWLAWDMRGAPPVLPQPLDGLLHAAPLWVLPRHVDALADQGLRCLVAFGSTSVLTKIDSASRAERRLAAALGDAERRLWEVCARRDVTVTLLRPTMVYGYGRDANISAIAAFIRRRGFFPVAGRAAGQRQPVHADDLAAAALAVLARSGGTARVYNLGGGECLRYRDMVARIFDALGRPRRIVAIPTPLYAAVLATGGLLRKGLTGSIATRMNRDMIFDCSAARSDFGYAAQPFLAQPQRDLPAP